MAGVARRLSLDGGAVDRLGLGAVFEADLDLLRLHLLGLRDVDLEHAVLVRGLDRILGHSLREAVRANEPKRRSRRWKRSSEKSVLRSRSALTVSVRSSTSTEILSCDTPGRSNA